MMEILQADIQKYEADAAQLAKEIAKHDEDIATWKKQSHDVKQAASALIQISASSIIPAESKKVIDAFLAQDPDDENLAVAAPEANAYEFQAQGIVDMLTKLAGKFEDERTDLEKEET